MLRAGIVQVGHLRGGLARVGVHGAGGESMLYAARQGVGGPDRRRRETARVGPSFSGSGVLGVSFSGFGISGILDLGGITW